MRLKQFALIILAVGFSSAAWGEVYKCQKGGETVFSDIPCEAKSKPITITFPTGPADENAIAAAKQRREQEETENQVNERLKKDEEFYRAHPERDPALAPPAPVDPSLQ